jgi:hypothetical protein
MSVTEHNKAIEEIHRWMMTYARELSQRGQLDNTSPKAGVEGARAAIVVREAADQMKKALLKKEIK